MPVVSVIIPVKNSSNTIGQCLESLSLQSYTDFETIIVGTEGDPTIKEVKNYPVRIVENPRNSGYAHACGFCNLIDCGIPPLHLVIAG